MYFSLVSIALFATSINATSGIYGAEPAKEMKYSGSSSGEKMINGRCAQIAYVPEGEDCPLGFEETGEMKIVQDAGCEGKGKKEMGDWSASKGMGQSSTSQPAGAEGAPDPSSTSQPADPNSTPAADPNAAGSLAGEQQSSGNVISPIATYIVVLVTSLLI